MSLCSDALFMLCFTLACSFLSQFIGSLMGGAVQHGPVNIQLYVSHSLLDAVEYMISYVFIQVLFSMPN